MYSQKLTDINCVNGADFRKDYVRFCFKFQLCPVRCIKKLNVNGTSLDCFIDAISSEHLLPLLNALAINRNLEAISLHSTFIEKFNQEMLNECRIYDLMQLRENGLSYKLPAVLRQELQTKLFTSLTNCISINKVLKQLEITGLPFTLNIMKQFSKAIESSNSLQYLSFAGCFIENEGLSVLCNSLKNNVSIKILNFSDCHITPVGVKSLTGFTKYQASMRLLSAWQGSLRYRQPILDSFPGVSRLILNDNESFGDVGAKILSEALSDDLWLKAIDLQNCGITSVGAKWLLNVLVQNTSIEILDMRRNPSIDNDISERIVAQLNLSNKGKVCEYEWLPSKKYCYCEPSTEIRKIKSTAKITSVQHQKPCSASTTKFSNVKNKGEKATYTSREKQLHPLASQEKQSETASTVSSESKEIDEWMETCLQLRRELKLCLQQLEVEQGRRKLAELEIEQLKGEGKSTGLNNGYVVVDEAMLATIHDTFTKFRYFIDFLRASCYNFESEEKHNEMKEEILRYPATVLNTEYNERHPGVPSVYHNSNSTIYANPQVPSQSSLPSEHPFFIEDVAIPITTLPKPSSTDDLFNIISQRIHNTLSSSLTLAVASSSIK